MASLVAVNRPRTPGPMSSGQVVGRRIVFAVRWRRMNALIVGARSRKASLGCAVSL